MKVLLVLGVVVAIHCCYCFAEEEGEKAEREKRSVGYKQQNEGYRQQKGYQHRGYGYEKNKEYKKSKSCYQCAYSPPKTYYDKKVVVESVKYGKHYGSQKKTGYKQEDDHYGREHGGYTKKSYVPVPYTINGGWDKCLGPFNHYEAQRFGVDVWDCHSNCYVRKDPNGNIFRGCYKGEFGVDPYKTGCHYQGGAIYCFCEGDKCNNGPAPH